MGMWLVARGGCLSRVSRRGRVKGGSRGGGGCAMV